MGRIRNTIDLAKASWGILKQDRELIWLPVMGFVLSVIAAAVVLVPVAMTTDFDTTQSGETALGPMTYVLLVVLSLALTAIGVFFKGALVSGANERMTGGDPTVSSAISGATAKLHRLLPWALLTGTVGLVLQALRERSGMLGRIVVGFIGGAWEVLTFLVVPVIILEDTGPIDSVKRSGELFKRTWGENLASQVGFGLLGFVAMIPMILLIVVGVALANIIGFVLIAAGVVGVAAVAMVISALSAIFQTALYHYAVGASAPGASVPGSAPTAAGSPVAASFDTNVLRNSFAHK